MSKFARLGAIASLTAVATAIATPAAAASAVAGSTITNSVTVRYKVGTVDQTPIVAQDTFTVDRKVNLTVVQDGTATTLVSPSATSQVTTFLVSNLTNATMDIALAAANRTGDDFDVSNFRIYRDNTSGAPATIGVYDAGDQLVTHLDNIAAETSNIRVFVVADVPNQGTPATLTNGKLATVRLTGTAFDAGAVNTLGSALTASGSNTTGMDTVFADTTAGGNTAADANHFADDAYEIQTALLSVVKSSRVIATTLNGVTNTFAIPGATIEYCIAVTNSTSTAASTVGIDDTLPTETTYDSGFGIKVDGTITGSTCNADGTVAGSYDSALRKVTGTIPSVTTGNPRTVLFRVTIN